VASQNFFRPTSSVNGSTTTASVEMNATPNTNHCAPRRSPRPDASNGTSAHGANLAAPPSATSAPRPAGERMKTSAQTTSAATMLSLEFDSSTYALYGNATHA
jgi:hypothetical protein